MKKAIMFFCFLLPLLGSCSIDNKTDNQSVTVYIDNRTMAVASILPNVGGVSVENTDISHYRIWLYRADSPEEVAESAKEDPETVVESASIADSGYLSKGKGSYTVHGIMSGDYWVARVRAYSETSGYSGTITDDSAYNFVRVAEAVSEPVLIAGSSDSIKVELNRFSVSEDALNPVEKAGDITVSLILPEGISAIDGFEYRYDITPLSNTMQNIQTSSDYLKSTVAGFRSESGKLIYDFSISEELEQGKYLLTVYIRKNESIERAGTEIMELLPGMDASGYIDFATAVELSPSLVITDQLGESIELKIDSILLKNNAIIISLNGNLDNRIIYTAYIDGKKAEMNDLKIPYKLGNSYLYSQGRHVITLIGRIESSSGVDSYGSVTMDFVIPEDPSTVVIN